MEDNVGVGSINGLDNVVSNGSRMEVLSDIEGMLVGVGSTNRLDMVVSSGNNMEVLSDIKGMLVDNTSVGELDTILVEGVGVGTKESGSEKEIEGNETVVVVIGGCSVEERIVSILDCMENKMEEGGEDLMGVRDSERIGMEVSTDCIENIMVKTGTEVDGRTCILVPSIEVTNGRECVVVVAVDTVCIVGVAGSIVGWKVRDISEVGTTLLGGTTI